MTRFPFWMVFVLSLFAVAAPDASAADAPTGFDREMFDGKTLAGWYADGCQADVKDGAIVIQPSKGWLKAQSPLADFIVEFEFRKGPKKQGKVVFRRIAPPDAQTFVAEGEILPLLSGPPDRDYPARKWYPMRLQVVGTKFETTWGEKGEGKGHGESVTPEAGFFGFQAPEGGDPLEIRNVKLTEIGFESLFNGKDLTGWHVSAASHHSKVSNNKSGGHWVIEDGAIVGNQDIKGNGGIVITDRQFKDCEVALEMKNDFGPDSGLFLRSNEQGDCYQYLIDYHKDGSLGGVYGEGLKGIPNEQNFKFLNDPEKIVANKAHSPLPISPEAWPKFWRHGEWNELRARITGNPPRFQSWINGVLFSDFTDDTKRHVDSGAIALQIHGGSDYTKQFVRYRNIRVKPLDK